MDDNNADSYVKENLEKKSQRGSIAYITDCI